MLTIRDDVQAFVRDRVETLRLSARAVQETERLITDLRTDLVKLRETIENGQERLKAAQSKLRRAKMVEWSPTRVRG
jgi:hypothetical protein